MTPQLVAHDMHVGDNDQNSTLWSGAPGVAPREFHRRKFLYSLRLIFDANISPDSARYASCADWKNDTNWAVRLPAQEPEGQQEKLLLDLQVGKEWEEMEASMKQQIGKKVIPERRHCQLRVKPVLVAQPSPFDGALLANDIADKPFATFRANDRYRQHCVMRAWD